MNGSRHKQKQMYECIDRFFLLSLLRQRNIKLGNDYRLHSFEILDQYLDINN
jgi:hypothetical protein